MNNQMILDQAMDLTLQEYIATGREDEFRVYLKLCRMKHEAIHEHLLRVW